MEDDLSGRPMFRVGQRVRVVPSERHQTVRVGVIYRVEWHYKDCSNNYYLRVGNTRISTRYSAIDLETVDDPAAET